jgi:tRNA-specific 2-thiouridylase
MSLPGKIAVAMSGGVDSSVAAALLVDQGEDVFGVMMRLWVEDGRVNRCCSPQDVAAARRVAASLGIPFYVLDMRSAFRGDVVEFFLDGYAQGLTPNPCMECNRVVRWTRLLADAVAMGASFLATGHYARVVRRDGMQTLLRGVDQHKDQSYVLSVLTQEQLARAVFPLGGLNKTQVRDVARRLDLAVADRPESQDLCFLAGDDYRTFLRRNRPGGFPAGPIIDTAGNRVGEHSGLPGYTIGQRRGLGVVASEPLYVVDKDSTSNSLIVGPRSSLGRASFRTLPANWIAGGLPEAEGDLQVQVRYRAPTVGCELTSLPGGATEVHLKRPLPDVTPGQSAVFYLDEVCLGGAIIAG